jgi:predicted short-subunit dehydrogenase-like oxidoreductase (DUF2520 family)
MRVQRRVSIIGAGRVGSALGHSLRRHGWRIQAVVASSLRSARRAASFIGAGKPSGGISASVLDAKVVIIATPDGSVAEVAKALARAFGKRLRGKIVLHTSGALDSSMLAPLARAGAATGSMHPMQSFSGRAAPVLRGAVFGIEGSAEAIRAARLIAGDLGSIPVRVRSQNKAEYHAAAVLIAGHGLALVEAATRILISLGFKRGDAARALLALMRQMLDNFERFGPHAAWTGPLSRGDYGTIARHVRALRAQPRETQELYKALTRVAAQMLPVDSEAVRRRVEGIFRPMGGKK